MKDLFKKENMVTIILIAIPIVGILAGVLYYFFIRKKGETKRPTSLPSGDTKGLSSPEETLFNDPSTYLENAKKYPYKWKKFIRSIKRKLNEVGESIISEPELKDFWNSALDYWLIEEMVKKNNPEVGLKDWLSGVASSPEGSIVITLLYNWSQDYKNGKVSKAISRDEARSILEKVGEDPYVNWINDFPEEAKTGTISKNLQTAQI